MEQVGNFNGQEKPEALEDFKKRMGEIIPFDSNPLVEIKRGVIKVLGAAAFIHTIHERDYKIISAMEKDPALANIRKENRGSVFSAVADVIDPNLNNLGINRLEVHVNKDM